MPPLPIAPNILRVTHTGTYGSAKWANVFHLRFSGGPPGQTDLNTLAGALATQWGTNIKALCNTTVSMTGTEVVDLSSYSGLTANSAVSQTGTVAATAVLPANVALVVSFKISRRYRGGHPRMYLTGQNGTNTTSATQWTGAWATTATAAFEAWRTAINALTYASLGTIRLVNLSYYSGKVLRASPWPDDVNSCIVHGRVDTMRRRLGKETA